MPLLKDRVRAVGALAAALLIITGPKSIAAQDNQPAPGPQPATEGLTVELNALASSANGCAATFVLSNDLPTSLQKLSLELAFFNEKKVVDRISTIDFGALPQGKTRVRKFNLPNVQCESLSRIVVNDAPVCDGATGGSCLNMLRTRSQTLVPFES